MDNEELFGGLTMEELNRKMDYLNDEFFEGLSKEEIEQLNSELCDDLLPAADRVKYHIDKKGQNFIDKEALSKWMEEAAVASQIGQDYIPFAKETKGKKFVKVEEKKEKTVYDDEFEKLLAEAEGIGDCDITDGDIDALAEILGANSLLGSVDVSSCTRPGNETGLTSPIPDIRANYLVEAGDMEEVNEIDVEETLQEIQNNDSSLTHCIFNNVPLDQEMIDNITSAMVDNTSVTKLDMCNCAITDESIDGFITLLKTNTTLESLSLETNKITGKQLKLMVQALEFSETLKELRIANQYFTTGVGDEMAISKALANNTSVVKFSLNWKNGGARNSADRLIMRNCDLARKKRQGIS